jgi:hypothetical protein
MKVFFPSKLIAYASLMVALAVISNLRAEEQTPAEAKTLPNLADMKANVKTGETPIPSPFDAFLALDRISKDKPVDWAAIFDSGVVVIDPSKFKDPVAVALLLGVKISDGLIAIKAKDTEALNDVSRVIESLARTLGVEQAILDRAEKVRTLANDGDWLGVFLELGFLQENIIESLKKEERKDQRALILASGWLQGARYACTAIEKNYSAAASNLLREPVLIEQLQKDLEGTSEAVKSHPLVQEISKKLPDLYAICNIGMDDALSPEKITTLRTESAALVELITK